MFAGLRLFCAVGLLWAGCCFGQSILSLSSASGEPGALVRLNISLITAYPGSSAGLQWTLNSPAGGVAAFSTATGPAAASAQKSLYCANQTCLLAGVNSTPLSSGVVATVTLTLSPTATGNLVVQLSNPVEVLLDGTAGSITAVNGIVSVAAAGVTIAAGSTTLYGAQSLQLSATITGASNAGAIWTMNPQVGALSSSGLYTAPATIAMPQTIVVTATSVADPAKSASVDVYLLPPVAVTLIPSTVSLEPRKITQFTASVRNASNGTVVWSLSPNLGAISNGEYIAPSSIRTPQAVTVTATSVADPTKTGTATIELVPFPLRSPRRFPPRN